MEIVEIHTNHEIPNISPTKQPGLFLRHCYTFIPKCSDRLCKYCNKKVSNRHYNVLFSHLRSCNKAPNSVVARLQRNKKKRMKTGVKARDIINCGSSSITSSDEENSITSEELDKIIAKFLFLAGVPISIVDKNPWKHFIKLAFAWYNPKGSTHIMKIELKLMYENEQSRILGVIAKQQHLSLITDGYTNINGHHIVNFLLCSPGMKPIFYKSINTTGTCQNAIAVATEILSIIEAFNNIIAVITDNMSTNIKAWEIIQARHKYITCQGCLAHLSNLLLKDLMQIDRNALRIKEARSITKFVNNHAAVLFMFEEIQNEKFKNKLIPSKQGLVLPCDTRWYSSISCLERIIVNRSVLVETFKHPNVIKSQERNNKFAELSSKVDTNDSFWNDIMEITRKYKKIVELIAFTEMDESNISEIFKLYNNLFKIENLSTVETRIINHRKPEFETDIIIHAHLLDPQNRFFGPTAEQIAKSESFFRGINTNETTEFMKYCAHNNTNISYDVLIWWKIYGKTKFPQLSNYALKVLSIRTSSAASERCWSIFKWIHNPRRARLTDVHVDQLIFLYMNSEIDIEIDDCETSYSRDYLNDEGNAVYS